MFLLLLVFLVVLGYFWPRYLFFLITVPLVGTALGGLTWGIAAMIYSDLVTWNALAGFFIGGNILTLVAGIMLDRNER